MSTWYHYLSRPFCPYFGVQVKKTKAHECMKPSPSNTNGKSKNGYSNWAYGIIILRGMCRSFGVQVSQKKKGKSKNSEAKWAHVMITLLSMYRSLRGASLTK